MVEGALTYESTWTPTEWRWRQARVADEVRDVTGTPRLLLGRAVARDEVDAPTITGASTTAIAARAGRDFSGEGPSAHAGGVGLRGGGTL